MGSHAHPWQAAAAFAARAHHHSVRKDGCTPYFSHPARVALTIACVFGVNDEATIAAALLHDTLEDTGADYDKIAEGFGVEVGRIVAAVSKDMRLPERERERAYDEQLARASWKARLIKLADVYDNLHDVLDAAGRRRVVARAERALKLAAMDDRCREARRIVAALVKRRTGKARGRRA